MAAAAVAGDQTSSTAGPGPSRHRLPQLTLGHRAGTIAPTDSTGNPSPSANSMDIADGPAGAIRARMRRTRGM